MYVSIYIYFTFSSQGLEKLKRKRNECKLNLILSWKRKQFTYNTYMLRYV